MTAVSPVIVEQAGGITTVTLNRPDRLNAFDRDVCDALLAALRGAAADAAVRAVIVTGAGRAFCAGADLAVLDRDGEALVAAGKAVALAIREAPKPVLAAVNGAAAGGGANLALACDYRIASEQAAIGQVFPRLGLGQDWGGSYFLPRLVRASTALELVWSARMVGAAYTAEFRQVYRDLAKLPGVTFMPFYLDGVAGLPHLNIADGMHPNAEGARIIERAVWRTIQPLLEKSPEAARSGAR